MPPFQLHPLCRCNIHLARPSAHAMNHEPITLRRATPADAADFARLMADPEVFGSLMQLPWPSEAMWRERLSAGAKEEGADLHLVAEAEGRVVGSLGLHPVNRVRRRHVAMLGISVALDHQGRGVGNALLGAACGFADRWAQLLRIELTVFTDNARALALYQRHGFRIEGTHVAYALRDGRFADVHAMARLHPAPPAIAWPPTTIGA
jgi:L-phenylalanine/L-methionine N-acetyltransferase